MLSHPGDSKVILERLVKTFLFHLGNSMVIIIVTRSIFPLIVVFDVCQILPCGGLMSQLQLQGYFFYISPSWDPQGSLVSVKSGWMWGKTLGVKDILLSFMTILRAGPDPRALVRLQFPPYRTINSLLTHYS
jgi:hypothetical protein